MPQLPGVYFHRMTFLGGAQGWYCRLCARVATSARLPCKKGCLALTLLTSRELGQCEAVLHQETQNPWPLLSLEKKKNLLMPLPTAAVSSYNFAGAAFGEVAVFQKMVPTELLSLQLTRLNCLLRAADTAAAFDDVNVEREPWDLILSPSLLHNPCSNLS